MLASWPSRSQAEYGSCFRWGWRPPAEFGGHCRNPRNQFGVAFGKAFAVELDVVFEAGPNVPAQLQRPAVHFQLVTTEADRGPGRIRLQRVQFVDEKLEERTTNGQGVLNTHHELNV